MNTTIQSSKHRYAVGLAALAAMLTIPTGLQAIVADGNVQGLSEGYTNEYDMSFTIAPGKSTPGGTPGGGKLYTALNGNVLSVGFIAPLTIDDNLYGTAAVGWTHPYSDLTGSDEWVLSIKNSSNKIFAITLDYGIPAADSGTYDGKTSLNSAITYQSSLGNDLLRYPTATTNSNLSGSNGAWISNIEYEWQIDFTGLGGSFTVNDLLAAFDGGAGGLNYFHMSPNKIGDNKVYGNTPTPTQGVPEAGSTAALLGLALLGMGVLSRKLRKA
jgi:hypothetical protein